MHDVIWYRNTKVLHGIAASVHALQAVVVLGLASWLNTSSDSSTNHGVFRLTKTVAVWSTTITSNNNVTGMQPRHNNMVGNYSVIMNMNDSGSLDVRYAILAFFSLAAIDHVCIALAPMIWDIEQLAGQIRFIEYSISASIMLICIAVEMGISDLYTIVTIFTLMSATQILGLVADLISNPESISWSPLQSILGVYIWIIPHFTGWITCIAAYVPILDAFVSSENNSSIRAPDFVKAIVFTQFFLFISFGFVQTYQLFSRSRIILMMPSGPYVQVDLQQQTGMVQALRSLNFTIERAFIVLSLIAKTLLAWLIMAPILMAAT